MTLLVVSRLQNRNIVGRRRSRSRSSILLRRTAALACLVAVLLLCPAPSRSASIATSRHVRPALGQKLVKLSINPDDDLDDYSREVRTVL